MKRMFIINAPFWFKAIWFIIKAFLDPKTVSKIRIFGNNYLPELTQYVTMDYLPSFLGGNCKCEPFGCLNCLSGPWKEYLSKMPKETDPEIAEIPLSLRQIKY